MGLIDSATKATTNLTEPATKALQNVAPAASGGITGAVKSVEGLADMAKSGITSAVNGAYDAVAGKVTSAIGSMQNKVKNMLDLGNIFESAKSSAPVVNLSTDAPYPNVLHNYASYDYIFTLSVIDLKSLANPETTYRKGALGEVILRSGSGYPNNRVQTAVGKFDFFIDDVNITSVVKPNQKTGNSPSTNITFKVTEPYSMGLFFTSLQTAAERLGYKNWTQAPFLLTVEFIGHVNPDMQGVKADSMSISNTTRYFPIHIIDINMTASTKGAMYDVKTSPYNEIALSTSYGKIKSDVSIAGKTVQEMLQTGTKSLQTVINDKLKISAKQQGIEPDEVVIYFPIDGSSSAKQTTDEASATTSSSGSSIEEKLRLTRVDASLVQDASTLNPVGKASMEFDSMRPGDPSFPKDSAVYDEQKKVFSRSQVSIDPNQGEMRFAQNTNIVNIINEVILSSGYSRQALKETQIKKGQIPWWKVETQVYLKSANANISKTGAPTRLIVFRVIPYGVNVSSILAPNATNPYISEIRRMAAKEYNYIYTGKNVDVLNFNINFKFGFYKGNSVNDGRNDQSFDTAAKVKTSSNSTTEVTSSPPATNGPTADNIPITSMSDRTRTNTGNQGGTSIDTPATNAARRAHDMFLSSIDMINLDMTIAGDPYYLGDSGIGNYIAGKTNNANINADHAIDTQSGENSIIVNFKTPIDIDPSKGAYEFGPTELVAQFSGVYNVISCESNFSKGKFTQVIKGGRQPGQTTKQTTSELPKLMFPTQGTAVPLNQSSEDIVASQNASVNYGTTEGSQQNEMLAQQDKDFQ